MCTETADCSPRVSNMAVAASGSSHEGVQRREMFIDVVCAGVLVAKVMQGVAKVLQEVAKVPSGVAKVPQGVAKVAQECSLENRGF